MGCNCGGSKKPDQPLKSPQARATVKTVPSRTGGGPPRGTTWNGPTAKR